MLSLADKTGMTEGPSQNRFWSIFSGAAMVLCFLFALCLRTYFVFDRCFTDDYVNFQGTDPWYHVRVVEHLIERFPWRLSWDPYALHPDGQHVAVAPLFDLVLAAISLAVGMGRPSQHLTHSICAWFPAVLGALVTVPVYYLGTRLLDRKAGLMAAALVAIVPGPFLTRSLLGYADHHVAETFFAALAVLLMLRAVEADGDESPNLKPTTHPRVLGDRRGLLNIFIAALALGVYLLSWVGGSLLVFILFTGLATQLLVGHLRRLKIQITVLRGAIIFALALVVIHPFHKTPGFEHHRIALFGGAFVLSVSAFLSQWMTARRIAQWWFPVALLSVFGAGFMVFFLLAPQRFHQVLGDVRQFAWGDSGAQVVEAAPLSVDVGRASIAAYWKMFGVSGFCLCACLPILGWQVIRRARCSDTLVLVWTILMALLMFRQVRFGYYFSVNVALLSGYFWIWAVNAAVHWTARWGPRHTTRLRIAGLTLVGLVGWLPNLTPSMNAARQHTGPSPDWHAALHWLRTNSAEPFGATDYYVQDYEAVRLKRSSYGVMCWWDHGYWITTIARRVPVANPTQAGAGDAARFFTAENEADANAILDRLKIGYVVVDGTLPIWETDERHRLVGKFPTIARWAGNEPSKFFETYLLLREDGSQEFATLYYPSYYRAMLTRLYGFGGRAVTPKSAVWAVRFKEIQDDFGNRIKRVEETMQFTDYAAAEKYLNERPTGGWRIVGLNPLDTCVPLEALRHYDLFYESKSPLVPESVERTRVKIFQYLRGSL